MNGTNSENAPRSASATLIVQSDGNGGRFIRILAPAREIGAGCGDAVQATIRRLDVEGGGESVTTVAIIKKSGNSLIMRMTKLDGFAVGDAVRVTLRRMDRGEDPRFEQSRSSPLANYK